MVAKCSRKKIKVLILNVKQNNKVIQACTLFTLTSCACFYGTCYTSSSIFFSGSRPRRLQNALHLCAIKKFLEASVDRLPAQKSRRSSSLYMPSNVAISGSVKLYSPPWMSTNKSLLFDLTNEK